VSAVTIASAGQRRRLLAAERLNRAVPGR
jgi:hypothetical protein